VRRETGKVASRDLHATMPSHRLRLQSQCTRMDIYAGHQIGGMCTLNGAGWWVQAVRGIVIAYAYLLSQGARSQPYRLLTLGFLQMT